MPAHRILVVDDEPDLVEVLCAALRYEGWETRGVATGEAAVEEARGWRPDAVVLDMMLPGMDGMTVLARIHAERPQVRVLFLTARDAVEDRIAGIAAGGDDYVTKPFSLQEVVVRLRGLLRRAQTPGAGSSALLPEGALVLGGLVLAEQSREVIRDGDPIDLSPTEFQLLSYLMKHPRQVLSKDQILDAVWSYDFGGQAHVVELYISYLRKKIDAGRAPMIHTVRGAGYLIKAPL
ncbi:response regulator transcription factor [Kitasatospora sp. GP82]|uniref:response regulator transcription factor n=1 Tax=Kitasatospora sp. GP82 TaxID=3035089 RepID=UPI002472F89D|nr:response regulator transcription factor [Kitasatospora sp. GP82]